MQLTAFVGGRYGDIFCGNKRLMGSSSVKWTCLGGDSRFTVRQEHPRNTSLPLPALRWLLGICLLLLPACLWWMRPLSEGTPVGLTPHAAQGKDAYHYNSMESSRRVSEISLSSRKADNSWSHLDGWGALLLRRVHDNIHIPIDGAEFGKYWKILVKSIEEYL